MVSRVPARFVLLAVLALAVMGSALGVVYARYESRTLFVELQGLQNRRDAMNVEWGQLELEQSTWTTHGRIERIAHDKLGMVAPSHETVVIIKP